MFGLRVYRPYVAHKLDSQFQLIQNKFSSFSLVGIRRVGVPDRPKPHQYLLPFGVFFFSTKKVIFVSDPVFLPSKTFYLRKKYTEYAKQMCKLAEE